MNSKHEQQMLQEAYEQIQEGLFDRLKARGPKPLMLCEELVNKYQARHNTSQA